jgi:hypothetical protein
VVDADELDAAADEDVVGADELELELGLDEQPATARSDRVTAPETPASRRSRVRRYERFMAPSVRSRGITGVSAS